VRNNVIPSSPDLVCAVVTETSRSPHLLHLKCLEPTVARSQK